MSKFDAERVSLEMIAALRRALEKLERRNAAQADQARRAATSTVHNISEGKRREGKDQIRFWRMAAGSAAELGTALKIAVVWGWLEEEEVAPAQALLDRVQAMLWRMTHPRVEHRPG